MTAFPSLNDWQDTRVTLHSYSRVLGAIRAAFAEPHPKWWHISLRPYTAGLTTTPIPHPDDPAVTFALSMDLRNHYILLSNSQSELQQFRMVEGLSANEMGEVLMKHLAELGIEGDINKDKYADESPTHYALDDAERYFSALNTVVRVFGEFRAAFDGDRSPVQLWPHHFDLSLEVFGEKMIEKEENGETNEYSSQIGFGFAPMDDSQPGPYFYTKPFPFEDSVTKKDLPAGASWFTDTWKGALLPYSEVQGREDGPAKLVGFLQAAYEAEREYI